jgi:hypothetical protein
MKLVDLGQRWKDLDFSKCRGWYFSAFTQYMNVHNGIIFRPSWYEIDTVIDFMARTNYNLRYFQVHKQDIIPRETIIQTIVPGDEAYINYLGYVEKIYSAQEIEEYNLRRSCTPIDDMMEQILDARY